MKFNDYFLLLVAALAIAGSRIVLVKTRGIRNNNPGNLRSTRDDWQGLAIPRSDGAFFVFVHARWGIRAMARLLKNYRDLYGLYTVREIINRWAPPNENNTLLYVESVALRLGVKPDAHFDVVLRMPEIIKAIIKHENGVQPYSDAQINEGIALA